MPTETPTTTYSAAQIVGKSMVARENIELKRFPLDSAKSVFTVKAGDTVGTVYSYVQGAFATVWWVFLDSKGKEYYAKHEKGAFDVQALKDQGALNVQEETEQQKKKEQGGTSWLPDLNLNTGDMAGAVKTGMWVLAGTVAVVLLLRK